MRLSIDLYQLDVLNLAPKLIGMNLCRNIDGNILRFRIIETEAYCGQFDTACHAHKGKTNRTKILYEQGGTIYVYLCYGIHYMLNVVSGKIGHPQAVLIRGIDGYDGPGKLTKALEIDKTFNGKSLLTSSYLWIEDDNYKCNYQASKRIGINYSTEEYRNKLWRFTIESKV